jgi:DNA-binding MarR family transcriptional regulator
MSASASSWRVAMAGRSPVHRSRAGTRPALSLSKGPVVAARLDPVIHERVRLGIVGALAARESMRFGELKALLRLTDGNLAVHARRLEEAGYVAVAKSFEGRVPRTDFRLTAAGRAALARYLREMEAFVRALRRG